MTKKAMVEYLKNELKALYMAMKELQDKYNAEPDHMNRIGMCIKLEKAQDAYYNFRMICNDLGIISPNENF